MYVYICNIQARHTVSVSLHTTITHIDTHSFIYSNCCYRRHGLC